MDKIGHECLAAGPSNLKKSLSGYNEFWTLKHQRLRRLGGFNTLRAWEGSGER